MVQKSESQVSRAGKSESQISRAGKSESQISRAGKSESQTSTSHGDDIRHLAALLREKRTLLSNSPSMYPQIQRLVDLEIWRIRQKLFQDDFNIDLHLPPPEDEKSTLVEKVFLPCKKYPEVNFVGRIIGPRGQTAKQIENATGCKVMIRGKGSMREGSTAGSPTRARNHLEHLEEDLHVLLHCDDTPNRAKIRVQKAIELINKISIPSDTGPDDLKRKQLIELAILNGTYKDRSLAEKSASSTGHSVATPSSSGYRTHESHSPRNLSPLSDKSFDLPSTPSLTKNDAATWIWRQLGISTIQSPLGDSPYRFNFDL